MPAGEMDSPGGGAVTDQGQVAWGVQGGVLRNLATAPTNACVEL